MIRRSMTGDQNLPPVAALMILPTKSCRNCLDETPSRELTRWEIATFGGCCTSRCTWSCSPLKPARVAPKSTRTCAMTCSHRLSKLRIEHATAVFGGERQVDVEIWTTLRPRLLGFVSHLGVGRRGYVACHEVPPVPERRTGSAPGRAVRPRPVRVEPRTRTAPDVGALARSHAGLQRPGRTTDPGPGRGVVACLRVADRPAAGVA